MQQRTAVRPGRIHRRTFAARVLGLSPDKHISSLKKYLFAARLTQRQEEKLDLVMVDDLEHYFSLITAEGLRLARDDVRPRRSTVTVALRPSWFVPATVVLCALLELAGENKLWDLLPWI